MQSSSAATHLSLTTVDEVEQSISDVAFVNRHLHGVFRFARALGADHALAADLAQEAFVVAWQRGKQSLPELALASFLRRTTRFLWLQQCRSDRRREAAIVKAAEKQWQREDESQRDARVAATRICIQKLNGRAREAVQLCYGEGRSRDQIAEALDMAPNGVKTLLARTRNWLAMCIERSNHETV